MKVRAGTLLQSGKYAIEAPLGQGYFGTTYRATHAQLWQPTVIKTLSESLLTHENTEEFVRQFVTQARNLARCHHPNLPRVLDLFEESGQPFVVLDYVPGSTLAQLVGNSKPMPFDRALNYTRQLASALETLHQNGLLHRDLKPDNAIRYVGSDRLQLIEVGLTRDLTVGSNQTHSHLLSPGYAAPEQYDNRPCTPATDIYGLAATCYYLLTGQPPAAAPLRDRIPLVAISQSPHPCAPAIERAVFAGLELDPNHRPGSVKEWLDLLPTITPEESPATAKTTTAAHSKPRTQERSLVRRPWVPALFATTSVVAAIGGAGVVVALKSGVASQSESPPSQLLRSTPTPRNLPSPQPEAFEEPLPDPDSWTNRDRQTEAEYTRNRWREAAPDPEPTSPRYDNRPYAVPESQFVPVQSEAAPEMMDPEPVLSDKPFTESDPDAPPLWSEPVPESLERPSNGAANRLQEGVGETYDAKEIPPEDGVPNLQKQELETYKSATSTS